jgi:hypothetical protein
MCVQIALSLKTLLFASVIPLKKETATLFSSVSLLEEEET